MINTIASVLSILMFVGAVLRYVWHHRERLEDWYSVASYQLTKPFKPPPKTTATLTVHLAGRIQSRRNPYTGEYITSRVDFDKD